MDDRFPTALVAVSRPGSQLALRLHRDLPRSVLFLPEGFAMGHGDSRWEGEASAELPGAQSPSQRAGREEAVPSTWHPAPRPQPSALAEGTVQCWRRPLGELIARLFSEYRSLVIFGAVGMAVRLLAPLARDKHTDPAVVVVDDGCRFAVSLLSGHLGGANTLAERVGGLLGAQPVITTGSEALGTLAVDLLGREFGWRLENPEQVTAVSAAVVDGEPVGLLQEAGEPNWWPPGRIFPPNLVRVSSPEELARARCRAALVITDRVLSEVESALPPTVIYRPRSLVAGVGCNRGTSAEEIETALRAAFQRHGLVLGSLWKLATVAVKRDEVGLQECAERLGVPTAYFSPEELDRVGGLPNPSAVVRGWVGTRGVCEPAALLASGAGALLVPKLKSQNVTVALARVDFSTTEEGV